MITPKTSRLMIAVSGLTALIGLGLVPQTTPASAQVGAPGANRPLRQGRERHPELHRALNQLQHARTALQNAAHDFAGHREHALDLTDQAIREVQLALQSDRR